MAGQIPLNTGIPLNYAVPGVYFNFDFSGPAITAINKTVVLLGYRSASSSGPANQPTAVLSQSDMDALSGARNTDLSRAYAALCAQLRVGSGVRVFGVGIDEPSAGAAATHLLWFRAGYTQAGGIESATSAQAPGLITGYECGWPISVGVQAGDTWNDIAANYLLARQQVQDYLPATASILGETVTLGASNAALSFAAKDNNQFLLITQKSAVNSSTTATYVGGVLSIALGADGGGTGNATPSDVKTVLDAITGLSAKIGYAVGGNGSGTIDYVYAQKLLPYSCVVLSYLHKGLTGNNYPIRFEFSSTAMKVGVVRGKVVIATNATGTSTHTITCNTAAQLYGPGANATPTTVAAALAAQLNGVDFQLKGGADAGTLWLYYAQKRTVQRLVLSTTDAAQTLTLTDRVSGGAFASSTASNGSPTTLQGLGAPTLTAALTALGKSPAFLVWAHPFSDTGSLSAIATHIEKYQDSPKDKGQTAHIAVTEKLLAAAAVPLAPTPRLTSSPRYVVSWCPGAWEQDLELAARTAALVAQGIDYPPKNYDGAQLLAGDFAPLHAPDLVEWADDSDLQIALANYYLTPLRPDDAGYLAVVSDRTTWKPGVQRLTRWGGILTMDALRDSLKVQLRPYVQGKNIKRETAYTPNCITPDEIVGIVKSWMLDQDKLDIYDGAASLFDLVVGEINPVNNERYDLALPMRWPACLSVVGIRGGLA